MLESWLEIVGRHARAERRCPATADLRRSRRDEQRRARILNTSEAIRQTDYARCRPLVTNVPEDWARRGQRGRADPRRRLPADGGSTAAALRECALLVVTPRHGQPDERRGNRYAMESGAWPRRSSHRHSPRRKCTFAKGLASYPAALDAPYGVLHVGRIFVRRSAPRRDEACARHGLRIRR